MSSEYGDGARHLIKNRLIQQLESDGWTCCSMHDPSGRRGIWYRPNKDGTLSIRAGREGDDADALVPKEVAPAVLDCLRFGAYVLGEMETFERGER